MAGNTAVNTTLAAFVAKLEGLYGRAEPFWVMDCVIPTDEMLAPMRDSDPPICCLVGMPKGQTQPDQACFSRLAVDAGACGGRCQATWTNPPSSACWRAVTIAVPSSHQGRFRDKRLLRGFSHQGRGLADSGNKRPYFSSQSYRQSGESTSVRSPTDRPIDVATSPP